MSFSPSWPSPPGTLFPAQASVNSLLAKSVGGAIVATSISITVSWFLLLGTNLVVLRQLPSVSDIAATPLYIYFVVGGTLGAIFLSLNVMLAPRLGAAATFSFVIAGQLIAALTIDPTRPVRARGARAFGRPHRRRGARDRGGDHGPLDVAALFRSAGRGAPATEAIPSRTPDSCSLDLPRAADRTASAPRGAITANQPA